MTLYNLNSETEEIRSSIVDVLEELKQIQKDLAILDQRNKYLRNQLANTLDIMGLVSGDNLRADDAGVDVAFRCHNIEKVDRWKLIDLGVLPEVIDKATTKTTSKMYTRLQPLAKKPVRNSRNLPTNTKSGGVNASPAW